MKTTLSLTGCMLLIVSTLPVLPGHSQLAVGRKIAYDNLPIPLECKGNTSLAVAVLEQRKQILDGSQESNLVGYMRSAVGIAWPLKTMSEAPLSDDLVKSICDSYGRQGFATIPLKSSANDKTEDIFNKAKSERSAKILLIVMKQWLTDGYGKIGLDYDLDIMIYDSEGVELVKKNFTVTAKQLGGGAWKGPKGFKEFIPYAATQEFGSMLNTNEICLAISSTP